MSVPGCAYEEMSLAVVCNELARAADQRVRVADPSIVGPEDGNRAQHRIASTNRDKHAYQRQMRHVTCVRRWEMWEELVKIRPKSTISEDAYLLVMNRTDRPGFRPPTPPATFLVGFAVGIAVGFLVGLAVIASANPDLSIQLFG